MPEMMKAAVAPELGKPLEIREVEKPEARPGRIIVKVVASGVCHTDLHAARGDWPVKPTAHYSTGRLENINAIFEKMEAGRISGRVVLDIADG